MLVSVVFVTCYTRYQFSVVGQTIGLTLNLSAPFYLPLIWFTPLALGFVQSQGLRTGEGDNQWSNFIRYFWNLRAHRVRVCPVS